MDKGYTETFLNLFHGTTQEAAHSIVQSSFHMSTRKDNWCGDGVYFYDVKAKACWAADRKCNEIKYETGEKHIQAVVKVDVLNLPKRDILDFRVYKDLCDFETVTRDVFDESNSFIIDTIDDATERRILLRSMLIAYYVQKRGKKLVVGIFRQRPQVKYEHAITFANSLDLIFGVETIYCVKDISILQNVEILNN